MTSSHDRPLVSPFTIRHEDRSALHSSRGFRILRSYLDENVESTFCPIHAQPATSHPTWLFHRAILHALVAPLVALYRRAASLASQVPCHPADLELVFHGAARDAFAWMQAFVDSEGDWCAGAGCPACLTLAATHDEGMVRLLLAGLEMAEQEASASESVESTPPEQRREGSGYPFPSIGGKFELVVDAEDTPIVVSDDTATESEDNDDLSESDLELCRSSTSSSLATSIAGSPSSPSFSCRPPSPPLIPPRRPALVPRTAPAEEGRPTLPSLGFFRTSLLEALAQDGFFPLTETTSRGHALAGGLRALIEMCREMEFATVVSPTPVDTEPAEPVAPRAEPAVAATAEEDDDEEVPIDTSRFKWVDEKDLLERRRRRPQDPAARYSPESHSDAEDERSSSHDEDDEEDEGHVAHDGESALDRLAAGWGMRQVWVRAGLGQIDIRERRRILGAIEDRAGKLRALSSRDRRRRGASGAF